MRHQIENNGLTAFDIEAKRLESWRLMDCLSEYCEQSHACENLTSIESVLSYLFEIERFWAYPGYGVMLQLKHYFHTRQFELFYQLCHNTYGQLQTLEYRRQSFVPFKTNLSDLDRPIVIDDTELQGKGSRRSITKTYFEVLVIHPNPADYEAIYRNSLAMYKSERDEFIYDILLVSSAEDALVAILANPSIQACVYVYGYQINSVFDTFNEEYADFINHYIDLNKILEEPLTGLKTALQTLRPEVSHYMISELALVGIDARIREQFDRVLFHVEPFQELHHTILSGIRDRYSTPFFDALRTYSKKPKGVFHALPLSRGQSLKDSHWITDMLHFYGANTFLAETSSTQGGMDSLLDPKGAIKQAHFKASRAFRSKETYFVTNGTSTSNKIVMQANLEPGDIVLTAADCHKSIPYAIMLSGAYPLFLETYPLNELDLYGAVPLKRIKKVLLDLRKQGQLHRVKQITLTNSTFDGVIYNTKRYMLDILAIKPDIIFHWDEAWFAFAYFNPLYEHRTAMSVANFLKTSLHQADYQGEYQVWLKEYGDILASDEEEDHDLLVNIPLMPDPELVKVRVYSTQSTHKTLTSFRQGSMLHIFDEQYNKELFLEAYRMHTSTSPNYQIIASLDAGRRQVSLEGYERVKRAIRLATQLRQRISQHTVLKQYFSVLGDDALIPTEYRDLSPQADNSRLSQDITSHCYRYADMPKTWGQSDFVVDPTKVTVDISKTGMDGTIFRELLINKYDIQVNKTSRKTVLFIVNIGANDSTIDYLIKVLSEIANRLSDSELSGQASDSVQSEQVISLPLHRDYHDAFVPYSGEHFSTVDMRRAYYAAFDEQQIEFVPVDTDMIKQVMNECKLVSASFVTPYPPGFPVLVPGQMITYDILLYLQKMRIKEIHGYNPAVGLKVFTQGYLESL
ncbi:aminotransferase class I/II-fold pyridoxal phosphate-dependent enzyme [Shewanella surugensis]|uniref:Orn/Lys/Arg decarboxylases family 1 pyridoxal-P attachment site domain-containing protein n=1 Tax=Shewanella surugensis TaxID=212020 RepID=A0ABT0LCB0_9GAMM|nr:hypothetical protein [Shewanella surugensis]MCL1125344.1 hypothetical protein [Shewanella surugensis]